ncbi:hypothetical protein NM151_0842 [Neisseria meningitidis NM151]|nr:hypothetical protein NM151_0842 [Neisseria meningitidis NM151]
MNVAGLSSQTGGRFAEEPKTRIVSGLFVFFAGVAQSDKHFDFV